MKDYIEERAVEIAAYIIDNNATVRQTAKQFGIKTIDTTPADTAYRISTVAPTSTKSITSAPTQSLLNFAVLVFRMLGVFLCLLKTKLTMKERMFCVIAYMPKATVQAAIGGVPLAMGLSCGNIVLTVAVTAILITAPLGAFLIEATYKKWLGRQTEILSR